MGKTAHTGVLALLMLVEGARAEPGIRLKARERAAGQTASFQGASKRRAAGRRHWLLEFSRPPGAAGLQSFRESGVAVAGAVSDRVMAVSAPDGTDFTALGASAAPLDAADKVSPLLAYEGGSAAVVEFHGDVSGEDARAIARDSGLVILEHPDLLPNQLLVAGGPRETGALSEWDEVAYIFPAAPELLAGERVAACSGGMLEQGPVGQYVAPSRGWGAGVLHYFFASVTGKLNRSNVESEVARALAEWGRYAPLEFTPAAAAGAPRTIEILFTRGSHGDGAPFDGPGKVLAHTYYPSPPNAEPLAGNMHLDEDEPWGLGTSIDLFSVALHEAGHALGLGHSDRPGTVMYPYYRQAGGLSTDDIAGIRELYGSREDPGQPPAGPPPAPGVTIAIEQPGGAAVTTAASSIALAGRAAGGSGGLEVRWRNDRGGEGTASGGALWTIAALPLSAGSNAITVTAADRAGASASARISVTRLTGQPPGGGNPDAPAAQAPALKIVSPALTIVSTSLASIALRGTASADAVSVVWSTSTGASGTAAGTSSWAAEAPLAKGSNTITVRAHGAGGASAWRSLTVVRK